MALSDEQFLDALSRTPFVDSTELAGILGEPHATVHRWLSDLLADGIVGRVSHGTAHLPSSQRYFITASSVRKAADFLGFDTPSDFVRAYPMFREWLTLLIRRMDAVASVYRIAATMSSGIDSLQSRVEFDRKGRFDATITLYDGRDFGVVRQGLALRRRSLYDRLRAIVEYDYSRRLDTWEERLTGRFCERIYLRDSFVAVESRDALERRDLRVWQRTTGLFGSTYDTLNHVSSQGSSGERRLAESPERKRSTIPDPERIVDAAPAFGISPSEKRTLDLITNHPMIPVSTCRLAPRLRGTGQPDDTQLGEDLGAGRVSRQTWRRSTHPVRRGHSLRYPPGPRRAPTTPGIWSTEITTDNEGRPRHVGHRIETWARQTKHADGVTWFLSKLQAEARAYPDSELEWSVPTARTDRAYNWGDSAIAPDAVGQMTAQGLRMPFYLEHELRARHPRGVIARLRPYESYYWSPEHKDDQPPYPYTLFVVDTEDVEGTYVNTAALRSRMSLPILVLCIAVLSDTGILGPSWRPLWKP